jgi:CelD/BcsL family acetyltransferase involved in cellulose biosynthesis
MFKIREVTNVGTFENFEDSWNDNLQKSIESDIFSTWEWLWCWWKHYGKERKLKMLLVEDDGEIIGAAPLMLSKYNFLRLGSLNKIEFIGCPQSDYNNFIILKKERECLSLFLNYLKSFVNWDLVELRDIHERSLFVKSLPVISNNKDVKPAPSTEEFCPYITLPSSIDVFLNRLSHNMRKNLNRRMRKLQREHKVEFKTQHDYSSIKEAMEVFIELHQKRWKLEGGPGAFASQTFRAFHINVAEVFDKKGWLALHFLTVDDIPAAAVYSFHYNLKKYGYLSGFDPDFMEYGVGNLLKLHEIEECIKNGYHEYDLARGFEPYKADWDVQVRRNLTVRIVSKNWFAKIYIHTMQSNFTRLLIEKTGSHFNVASSV